MTSHRMHITLKVYLKGEKLMKVLSIRLSRCRVCAFLLAIILVIALLGSCALGGKKISQHHLQQTCLEFLDERGWKVDVNSERIDEIQIPLNFSGIYQEYNQIQKEQGFDLEDYRGEVCKRFRYSAVGFNDGKEVELCLYKGEIIAVCAYDLRAGSPMEKL